MDKKTAIITGIAGADGPYLAKNLLAHDYKVIGIMRQNSQRSLTFMDDAKLTNKVELVSADITDNSAMSSIIAQYKPTHFFNLAAMSHPGKSFKEQHATLSTTGMAVADILSSIKTISPATRFCNISSSDIFAYTTETPQKETSPRIPNSPYGAAKILAHNMVEIYRQAYGLFACNAICYGHESPRRTADFVTGKIIDYVVRYKKNRNIGPLKLGNLDAMRDWGDAPSFVDGWRRMMEIQEPGDYIFCSGQAHSVQHFCTLSFAKLGINLIAIGEGKNKKLVDALSNKVLVESCEEFYRPAEAVTLVGDFTKAYTDLCWHNKMMLHEIVDWMYNVKCSSL